MSPRLPITRKEVGLLAMRCELRRGEGVAVDVPINQLETLLAIARMVIGRNPGNEGYFPAMEWYQTSGPSDPPFCADCGSYDIKAESSPAKPYSASEREYDREVGKGRREP